MSIEVRTVELTVTITLEAHEKTSDIEHRIGGAIEDLGESCDMIAGDYVITSEREHTIEVD